MSDKYTAGLEGEAIACAYLEDIGMQVMEKRYRGKGGEIDIIARQGNITCFVEVKYRPNARLTEALGAVDNDKRRRVRQVAGEYMQKNRIKPPVRFDIIEITRAGVLYMKGNPS